MSEQAPMDMVWGLMDRLQREEANLTPRAISRIHAILDDCLVDYFPDTASQTKQARWIQERIDREEGGGFNCPETNNPISNE